MLAFSRLVSVLFFLFSFTFFASAHSTTGNALVGRDPTCSDKLVSLVTGLHANIDADTKVLVTAATLADASACVDIMVGHVKACAEAILEVGANIDIDVSVKVDLAAKVAAIISLIVRACLEVSLKLGLRVVLALFAKLDLCIKLLLVNLGICVEGIVALIAKIVLTTCADLLVSLNFNLCLRVLALVKL